MASLTADQRNALPDSDFGIPERREYPIFDKPHAIDALSRVSQNGTQEEQRRVARAVNRRYPDIREKMRGIANGA